MYANVSLSLWLCITFSFIGIRLLALAILFWLPSMRTSKEGMRLLEPDNISPVGLRSMISYHFIPNGNSLLDSLKRFFIMIFDVPFPFYSVFAIPTRMDNIYSPLGPTWSVFYMVSSCFLYITLSIFMSFGCLYESPGRCGTCRRAGVKPRRTVREEIKHHFYLQRECLKKYYRMFSYLVSPLATISTSRLAST